MRSDQPPYTRKVRLNLSLLLGCRPAGSPSLTNGSPTGSGAQNPPASYED